jgi:hypothetical protein
MSQAKYHVITRQALNRKQYIRDDLPNAERKTNVSLLILVEEIVDEKQVCPPVLLAAFRLLHFVVPERPRGHVHVDHDHHQNDGGQKRKQPEDGLHSQLTERVQCKGYLPHQSVKVIHRPKRNGSASSVQLLYQVNRCEKSGDEEEGIDRQHAIDQARVPIEGELEKISN